MIDAGTTVTAITSISETRVQGSSGFYVQSGATKMKKKWSVSRSESVCAGPGCKPSDLLLVGMVARRGAIVARCQIRTDCRFEGREFEVGHIGLISLTGIPCERRDEFSKIRRKLFGCLSRHKVQPKTFR
jgi:hypothetical protein